MIVCIVICAVVSFILFFPFTFWIDGEVDKVGAKASAKFFKKRLFNFEKVFGEDDSDDEDSVDEIREAKPVKKTEEYSAPKPAEKDEKTSVEKLEAPAPVEKPEEAAPKKTEEPPQAKTEEPSQDKPEEPLQNKPEVRDVPPPKDSGIQRGDSASHEEDEDSEGKKKKKSLTSKQSWTILLTPEFDAQAWWAAKNMLGSLFKLFQVKFYNCFVEGIRFDYATMGQLASLNAFLQSYPYIGAWDFRMDWTGTAELRSEGHVRIRLNICRVIGVVLAVLFYGGLTAFRYWRRRAHVLKTDELPELGFIRNKIVNFMAEED